MGHSRQAGQYARANRAWRLERLQYRCWILRTDQPCDKQVSTRGRGDRRLCGLADRREDETLRSAWFEATDEARRHDLADQIQQRAFEFVPYIPTGELIGRRAFRRNLSGVIDAPITFLWNIEKRE
jgi:hypothetical protein